MPSRAYPDREIDRIYATLDRKIDALTAEMREGFSGIHARQDKTNGKVNKVVLAMVLVGGLSVGLGLQNADVLIKLLGI